ncbi:hypothetical protein [Rhodoferax sp.]|nr:hypothetical protein [Rhodoferax sp.]MDO9195919.1 hypothetical protein [Rhodoferax sp.]
MITISKYWPKQKIVAQFSCYCGTEIENILGYLGIEVEDAHEMAEYTDT